MSEPVSQGADSTRTPRNPRCVARPPQHPKGGDESLRRDGMKERGQAPASRRIFHRLRGGAEAQPATCSRKASPYLISARPFSLTSSDSPGARGVRDAARPRRGS
ncbi:hypothetical protein SKAU_G00215670 [Synaphobranchus kaupii]|uniref:Uncharacterized protein n=1 Tax=Synaphobranchus kaupii TaxID=118154 RepID=A0A9Q1ITC6_SYNKA|nr:hypothetical protein SKAU_G00215670 [Synaphobranchus kaupii]